MGVFQVFLLTALTLQTAANVILIKYAFSREGPKIHSAVLVLYIEVVKLVLSLAAYLFENGSCGECFRGMCRKVCDGTSFLRCAGLSLMYVAQNNTAYLALKHMNAALFQVTYQIKIPITAILCVCMLKKKISRCQWFSLLLLTAGVAFLHLEGGANAMRRSHDNATIIHQSTLQSHSSLQSHKAFLHVANKVPEHFRGAMFLVMAAVFSSIACVYNEKILKSNSSVWAVNIQLYISGIILATVAVFLIDLDGLKVQVFVTGLDYLTAGTILLASAGGVIVSLVLKHTDNVLKNFGESVSIVLSAMMSYLVFNEEFGWVSVIGIWLVMMAIPLYAKYAPSSEKSRDFRYDWTDEETDY